MAATQDDGVLVGVVEKNSRGEEVRVYTSMFNGARFCDIRTWYPADGGEMRPGKGVRFRADLLPELLPLLHSVAEGGEQ